MEINKESRRTSNKKIKIKVFEFEMVNKYLVKCKENTGRTQNLLYEGSPRYTRRDV